MGTLKVSGSKPFIKTTYKAKPGTCFQKSALTHRYFRLMQYSMFQPSLANDTENLKKIFFLKLIKDGLGRLFIFLSLFLFLSFAFSLSLYPLLLSHSLSHAESFWRPWQGKQGCHQILIFPWKTICWRSGMLHEVSTATSATEDEEKHPEVGNLS